LTREKDVIAHLFFAAAEIGVIELEVGGTRVSGAMTFPVVETRSFSFIPHEGTAAAPAKPREGQVVRVFYGREGSTYEYLTAITDCSNPQRWQLEFPRTIERNQARIAARHRVEGQTSRGYSVRIDFGTGDPQVFSLFDLSTAGLGFVFSPAALSLQTERALAGNLTLPGNTVIPLLLEIRSIRPLSEGSGQQVCGCRFIGISSTDQALLAQALAEWKAIRGG